MKKLEAVIFDWAGTTVDYGCFAPVQAFAEVFKAFGIEPAMEEVREPMGMLKRDHIKAMLAMPRIRTLWEEKYGRPSGETDIDSLYQMFEGKLMSILESFTDIKPGVLETVKILREKGISIGSTTGYTDGMMEIVVKKAEEHGYKPDAWFSPDSTNKLGEALPIYDIQKHGGLCGFLCGRSRKSGRYGFRYQGRKKCGCLLHRNYRRKFGNGIEQGGV